jgi:hypothetical protein
MLIALRSRNARSTAKRRAMISALTGAVLLTNTARAVAVAIPEADPGIAPVPASRPAQQATESAQIRLELLRLHAAEQAARRLERSADEPPYRFLPTRRPADLMEPRQ